MKNHKLGILKVRDNFQSCGEIESTQEFEVVGMCVMDVITHYDLLVDENNDPFRDPPPLQEYMNGWDGELF